MPLRRDNDRGCLEHKPGDFVCDWEAELQSRVEVTPDDHRAWRASGGTGPTLWLEQFLTRINFGLATDGLCEVNIFKTHEMFSVNMSTGLTTTDYHFAYLPPYGITCTQICQIVSSTFIRQSVISVSDPNGNTFVPADVWPYGHPSEPPGGHHEFSHSDTGQQRNEAGDGYDAYTGSQGSDSTRLNITAMPAYGSQTFVYGAEVDHCRGVPAPVTRDTVVPATPRTLVPQDWFPPIPPGLGFWIYRAPREPEQHGKGAQGDQLLTMGRPPHTPLVATHEPARHPADVLGPVFAERAARMLPESWSAVWPGPAPPAGGAELAAAVLAEAAGAMLGLRHE